MRLGLGNTLVNNGLSNPDLLSLDLNFAADKTLTARRGPTPAFVRSSTATFVGSDGLIQTATTDIPRFDHDPVTLACKGLLIEEQRTNLNTHSGSIGDSSYVTNELTVGLNLVIAPDGSQTGTLITTSAGAHTLYQLITVLPNTAYVFSFYAKKGTQSALAYSIMNRTSISNIVDPTLYNSQINSSTWTRISVPFTTPAGCTSISAHLLRDSGAVGTNYFWGAQLEAGSFPTSYIPTTTETTVRSADVCSITGADFAKIYNATGFSLYAEASFPFRAFQSIVGFDNGTTAEQAGLLNLGTESICNSFATSGGVNLMLNGIPINANIPFKIAATYKSTDFKIAGNGTSGTSSSTVGMPTLNTFRIGKIAGGQYLSGHIKSLRVYNKSLTATKIQSLTT